MTKKILLMVVCGVLIFVTTLSHAIAGGNETPVVEASEVKADRGTPASGTGSSSPAAAEAKPARIATAAAGGSVPATAGARSDKNAYAIVIGVEQYRQNLPKADFAINDAQAVTEMLTKAMGYPAENVITLVNDQATNADVAKYVEKWLQKKVKSGGSVFVFFSGLGTSSAENGDVFLVPYDGDLSFIEHTGYSLKRMSDMLGKLPAKDVTVVLDSCFAGTGGKSVLLEGARPHDVNLSRSFGTARNVNVIAASSGSQSCSSYQLKGQGLLTHFMIKGVQGEDVLRPDGSYDINDLFGYIKPQVERIARTRNHNAQTPQLIVTK